MSTAPVPASAAVPTMEKDERPLYVCIACLQEQRLPKDGELMCHFCAHSAGTSKVFFKKRVVATEYDAK